MDSTNDTSLITTRQPTAPPQARPILCRIAAQVRSVQDPIVFKRGSMQYLRMLMIAALSTFWG